MASCRLEGTENTLTLTPTPQNRVQTNQAPNNQAQDIQYSMPHALSRRIQAHSTVEVVVAVVGCFAARRPIGRKVAESSRKSSHSRCGLVSVRFFATFFFFFSSSRTKRPSSKFDSTAVLLKLLSWSAPLLFIPFFTLPRIQ